MQFLFQIKVIAVVLHSMFSTANGFHVNHTGYHFNFKRSSSTMLAVTECTFSENINNKLQQIMGHWTSIPNEKYPSPILQHINPGTLPKADQLWDNDISFHQPCPVLQLENADPLHERSICSWKWKRNYDPKRLPNLLFEANCSCNRAAISFAVDYKCEPVRYKIKVLRFDPFCQKYKRSHEEIVVACVAVARASHQPVSGEIREIHDDESFHQI